MSLRFVEWRRRVCGAGILVALIATSPVTAAVSERGAQRDVDGPLLMVVSLASQRMEVHGPDGHVATTRVSTGMAGHRTPAGVFSIIQKNRFHRSNIYSGAPMPFMQRITWSGIALHAGALPGYPASHGCIRLPADFASRLFAMTRMGARVVITPSDAAVRPIRHAALPVPVMSAPADLVTAALSDGAAVLKVAAAGSPQPPALLNPAQRAQAARASAASRQQEAARQAKSLLDAAAAKAEIADEAREALGEAEDAFAAAQSGVEKARTARDAAKAPAEIERTQTALDKAGADLGAAADMLTAALADEAPKRAAAFAAAEASKQADAALERAGADHSVAVKAQEPLSVLISRKDGKLYVRQGWTPMFESPVGFKDPADPLGTHTFLAVAPEAGGSALSWLVVSHPETSGNGLDDRAPVRRLAADAPRVSPAGSRDPAAAALDRVELSAEAKAFLADRAWVGASLIVTDEGPSSETGQYTDFIVLTK